MKKQILSISLFIAMAGAALFISSCGKDETPPVITLLGDETVTITLGDSYVDLGAAATDDEDGQVSVSTTGTVDESTEGTYTLTYTASDKEGNTATANRTVIVEITRSNYPGSYNVSSTCTSGNTTYSSTITTSGTSSDGIIIGNFGDASLNVNATVSGHSITIPSQTPIAGVTVSGSGTFNGKAIVLTISYTATSGLGTDSCTDTFTKQ